MRIIEISDNLELAVPEDCEQVVLGCPETREDVVILYSELPQVLTALITVADEVYGTSLAEIIVQAGSTHC